jgi:hypothetical protein
MCFHIEVTQDQRHKCQGTTWVVPKRPINTGLQPLHSFDPMIMLPSKSSSHPSSAELTFHAASSVLLSSNFSRQISPVLHQTHVVFQFWHLWQFPGSAFSAPSTVNNLDSWPFSVSLCLCGFFKKTNSRPHHHAAWCAARGLYEAKVALRNW